MLNFTKDKWVLDHDNNVIIEDDYGDLKVYIASVFGYKEERPNARLIAAAPELYDIVKSLAECQAHSFSELKMRASNFIAQLEQEDNQ